MHEGTISPTRLATTVAWTVTAGLLAATWLTWAMRAPRDLWIVLGFTTCVCTGVAAVAQIRGYALDVARLVRLTSSESAPRSRGMHPVDD